MPTWFAPYARALRNSPGGDLRVAFSAPPQHGKTELTLHALVWLVINYPHLRHAYITYSAERAREVSLQFETLLTAAGVKYTGTLKQWRVLGARGSVKFASLDTGLTGAAIDGLAVIDDPYKDDRDASSRLKRQRIETSYRSTVLPRMHPGASIVVMCTRWHPEDLIAVVTKDGFEYINTPCEAEGDDDPLGRAPGELLAPAFRPRSWVDEKKKLVGPHHYAQLYQGRPRLRGAGFFGPARYYSALPAAGYRGAYGVDLAYTAKTSADESVLLELWRVENPDPKLRDFPTFYVVNVEHARQEAPDFAGKLQAAHKRHPDWRMRWRCSGTERGSAQFLKRPPYSVPLVLSSPPGDKQVSANEVAIAWNAGRVLVPDPDHFPEATWVNAFVRQVEEFTGTGDEHDDMVDALGNAHLELKAAPSQINILPAAPPRSL